MRVDIHSHFQSLDYVKHLQGRGSLPMTVLEEGQYFIECGGGLSVPAVPSMLDMDQKLADMDAAGVDIAVLSHGIPLGPDALGGAEADQWASHINDDLARIVTCHPDRLVGFGSIGFGDVQRSISEVTRCIEQLGFKGFQIFSNVAGQPLDSPRVLPVIRHIASLGVPVHLHPAIPLNRVAIDKASLALALGFPLDTSLNTLRLIQCGLLDEFPDFQLIVAHVGGVIPYLKGRISTYHTPSMLVTGTADLAHPIENYLDRLFVDTVCYDFAAIECCYRSLGSRQMLYGTDHPFGAYRVVADLVEQLNCSAEEREQIYHVNAERLLKLRVDP
jgi:predicted TIM-barrel fold metal-dependent hydrolase